MIRVPESTSPESDGCYMKYEEMPLSQLLQDRTVFGIFDEEFRNAGWLDVTVLLDSESTIEDLVTDGTVPKKVLDSIKKRIEEAIS